MSARTTHILVVLLFFASLPLAAKEAKPSLDLSLPLSLLSGIEGTLTLGCSGTGDSDTHQMIQALQRQGRRGGWSSGDDGDRLKAVRRGDRFRLRAWEDGTKRLDLEMPWEVAECLFGGQPDGEIEVAVESLRGGGGFRLELAGDRGGINVSVD